MCIICCRIGIQLHVSELWIQIIAFCCVTQDSNCWCVREKFDRLVYLLTISSRDSILHYNQWRTIKGSEQLQKDAWRATVSLTLSTTSSKPDLHFYGIAWQICYWHTQRWLDKKLSGPFNKKTGCGTPCKTVSNLPKATIFPTYRPVRNYVGLFLYS